MKIGNNLKPKEKEKKMSENEKREILVTGILVALVVFAIMLAIVVPACINYFKDKEDSPKEKPAKEQSVEEQSIKEEPVKEHSFNDTVRYPYFSVEEKGSWSIALRLVLYEHKDKDDEQEISNCIYYIPELEEYYRISPLHFEYLNKHNEEVTFFLTTKDEPVLIVVGDSFGQKYRLDCREPEDALLCENEVIKERIVYYREQFDWHTRLANALEKAKDPKEHLKMLPIDTSKHVLEVTSKMPNQEFDKCEGKDYCHIYIVLRDKLVEDGSGNNGEEPVAEYNFTEINLNNDFPYSSYHFRYKNIFGETVFLMLTKKSECLVFSYPLASDHYCGDIENKNLCRDAEEVVKFFNDILKDKITESITSKVKEEEEENKKATEKEREWKEAIFDHI